MSHSSLIEWFEQLLFGHNCPNLITTPCILSQIAVRLEAEGIFWKDMVRQGGLTNFRYQIQGDLDILLEYFEKESESLPTFRTRVLTNFFNQLIAILARRTPPLRVTQDDKSTLNAILSGSSGPFQYESAEFWGDLARQWLSRRRPLPKELYPLPDPSASDYKRANRLYDVTCASRGERLDPLATHMVPSSEYVNAVHWQSDTLLEAFVNSRPDHSLSQAIKQLILKALNQFLDGNYPSCLDKNNPKIYGFLQNISVINDTVPEVTLLSTPPRVIDVFQRLLAVAHLDGLWQTSPPSDHSIETSVTDVMRLTEQLLLKDRQNQILIKHIPCD